MSLDISFAQYQFNFTHNLTTMARHLYIYEAMWTRRLRPRIAGRLIEPVTIAIRLMEQHPEYYSRFNAPNQWGTYEQFLPELRKLLAACIEQHYSILEISG